MRKLVQFRFSTVVLISGGPKHDKHVGQIARTLKKVGPSNLNIIGVIGQQEKSHFTRIFASSSILDNNEFQVTRAYNTYHEDIQDSFFLPYRTYTHFCNMKLIKELKQQNFFSEIYTYPVSAIATVGNFSLANRLGQQLNQYGKQHNKVKPFTALFHRQISERTVRNQQQFDFQYYNIEKDILTHSGYRFPSLCIGYDGLYRAFQYLQTFKKDHESDSFASETFSHDVSELVRKARASYRASQNIPEDSYVFYIDAGDDTSKAKFSLNAFSQGFSNFLRRDKLKNIPRSHFTILVNSPEDKALAEQIKSRVSGLPKDIKITLVSQKDRYAAMSAADFGLLHNGEATVEAAAVQLPSLVVDNMSNIHAYFNNLYNGHASPLNIATNYEAYEDLCGSFTAIEEKLGTIMQRYFETPKLRYYLVKLYREQIQKILSRSGTNPRLAVSELGYEVGCRHFLEKAGVYSKLDVNAPFARLSQRKTALTL